MFFDASINDYPSIAQSNLGRLSSSSDPCCISRPGIRLGSATVQGFLKVRRSANTCQNTARPEANLILTERRAAKQKKTQRSHLQAATDEQRQTAISFRGGFFVKQNSSFSRRASHCLGLCLGRRLEATATAVVVVLAVSIRERGLRDESKIQNSPDRETDCFLRIFQKLLATRRTGGRASRSGHTAVSLHYNCHRRPPSPPPLRPSQPLKTRNCRCNKMSLLIISN